MHSSSIKPLHIAQNNRLSPTHGSFLSSSPHKSFIWKFSINKVLGRISNQPNRSPFSHSGNNALGKSNQRMGRRSSPLFTEMRKGKLPTSAPLSLLQQPHSNSACPTPVTLEYPACPERQGTRCLLTCRDRCKCENTPGAPWYLWIVAKGHLYPY